MTDNEIIKALEGKLPLGIHAIHEAIDLINRQKAEIEQLKIENRILSQKRISFPERLEIDRKARAEAVKEFAELLKEHIRDYHPYYYVIDEEVVDNLVKEMVGEG